jgi:hypothetical protein
MCAGSALIAERIWWAQPTLQRTLTRDFLADASGLCHIGETRLAGDAATAYIPSVLPTRGGGVAAMPATLSCGG